MGTKLSHKLLDHGWFCALGTTERRNFWPRSIREMEVVELTPPFLWDNNNAVTAVSDEDGRTWIKRGFPDELDDLRKEFRLTRGLYVPHSNDGGNFVIEVLPKLIPILALVLWLFTLPQALDAQTSWGMEMQSYQTVGSQPSPKISAFTSHRLGDGPVSVTGFVLVSREWGEGLGGLSYRVSTEPFMAVGVMAGFEQPTFSPRFLADVLIAGGATTLYAVAERGQGTGNFWYMAHVEQKVSRYMGAGLFAQRYDGVGPRVSIRLNPTTFWVATVWNPESQWSSGLVAGVTVRF